jgi:hypothetical protein
MNAIVGSASRAWIHDRRERRLRNAGSVADCRVAPVEERVMTVVATVVNAENTWPGVCRMRASARSAPAKGGYARWATYSTVALPAEQLRSAVAVVSRARIVLWSKESWSEKVERRVS